MNFLKSAALQRSRLDKGYSLTDCISMNVCRKLGIKEILTHDRHFEQEGFEILLWFRVEIRERRTTTVHIRRTV